MRARSVLAVGLFALLACAAPASALVGPVAAVTDPNTLIVSSHHVQAYFPLGFCASDDPALGVVSSDVTSTFRQVAQDSSYRVDIHLDAALGGDTCPAMDLGGTTTVAIPPVGQYASGGLLLDCGGAAWLGIANYDQSIQFMLYVDSIPAACGVPFDGPRVVGFRVNHMEAAGMVCSPMLVQGCSGHSSWTSPDYGCGPQDRESIDVMGITIVGYYEYCAWWDGSGETHSFGDGLGIVGIVTNDDGCSIHVLDLTGGVDPIPCPAEMEETFRSHPWVAVFEALP